MATLESENHHAQLTKVSTAGLLIALGIIYGDIGTSPLYVMKAIIKESQRLAAEHGVTAGLPIDQVVMGAISCIIWTLTLLTTIKYVTITLRADNKGEGGIFSLFALVRRRVKWLIVPAIIGGSALLADGLITPPISVASAVEGLRDVKGLEDLRTVPIVIAIIVGLFIIQQFGTRSVGRAFGPIMIVWFSMLGVLGIRELVHVPEVSEGL